MTPENRALVERLERIAELAAVATPGPWRATPVMRSSGWSGIYPVRDGSPPVLLTNTIADEDRAYIAAMSPDLLPEIIAALRERGELDAAWAAVEPTVAPGEGRALVERLEELDREMSKAPWEAAFGDPDEVWFGKGFVEIGPFYAHAVDGPDAKGIAQLRNALPEIVAALEERDRLRGMVGLAADELTQLAHDGWSGWAEVRALGFAASLRAALDSS